MLKRKLIAVSAIIIVVAAVFSVGIWYRAARDHRTVIEGPAKVNDIQIVVLESFPVQVNVVVHGEFPDSCTEIGKVTTTREGSIFIVTIITRRASDAVCAQVITPFERVIALDVVGLKKGIYTVEVNGVRDTFELQADNILQNVGFLEGKVEIGPLCPVEPCNLTQDQIAQAYEARKIIVYTSDRSSIVAIVSLDKIGNYKIALSPGRYVADINRIGIDSSADVPREITIETGKTVRLDIRIDTGIR
jgi:inhibitor of cysteine peptidase